MFQTELRYRPTLISPHHNSATSLRDLPTLYSLVRGLTRHCCSAYGLATAPFPLLRYPAMP
eukprot:3938928-Rhodomonas_salina.2